MTVVRAAYGLFYDYPHFDWYGDLMNTAPLGNEVGLTNLPGGFADPWQGNGGNPFPINRSPNMTFPLAGSYSLVFLINRRYTELGIFLVAAVVVGWMVFSPDQVAQTARAIGKQILP